MAMSIDLNAGGSASFAFETAGDTVTGSITNMEELQQTDLQTGQPKTFDNGQPMMMYRVELQTDRREDSEDDGVRSVYLKGSKKPESQSSLAAVLAAVKAATGRYNLSVGGILTLTYIGDGQAKQRGFNAPKLYAAQYVAPSVNLDPQAPVQQQWNQPVAQQQAPVQQQWNQPANTAPAWSQPAAPQAPVAPVQQQPTPQPMAQQAPAAAPAAPGPDPAAIAALQAAGVDPASIYPGWQA